MIVPVKTFAYRALVAALEAACPAMKDRISFEAERDEKMAWPKCGIRAVRHAFRPMQRLVHRQLNGETVYDVGHLEALVQLRLGAPTQRQRVDLGEQLLGAFMSSGRPGILVTHLAEAFGATASWELDEEGWGDEAAFDQKRWSTLLVNGFVPVLVREKTYALSDLRIALEGQEPATPVETVKVNADGSTSKV